MSDLNKSVESLSPERRALLERLMLETRAKRAGNQAIPRYPHNDPCPLSFSQQLMWLSDQLIPQGSTYNVPIALRLEGTLNRTVLQRTLEAILARHEALRTAIHIVEDNPVQIITEIGSIELPIIDVSGNSEAQREDEMRRMCLEEACRPFDLSKGMLLRAVLFRLGPRHHVLLLTTHHIAFDGGSRKVLFREMEALYRAFVEGKQSPLPELPIQYADYAVWQRTTLQGEVMESHLAYWKGQLEGAPPFLDLPTDRPRPAVQTFRGARQMSSALRSVMESLKRLRRDEGATLYMLALAAFSVLLYRHTGQEDFVVGTPVLGRERSELEGLIGYLSNTLALRMNLSGDPTFRELLARTREIVLGGFDHQDMPLDQLVMELQPARDPSRSPLFQVLFSAGNIRVQPPKLPGLQVSTFKIDRGITKLDLMVAITEASDEVMDVCEYSTDLFDDITITRMLEHFHTLVESIVANPDQHISELPILTAEARRQLLVEWNNTQVPYPRELCIHQLIERQVARTPDAVAVEFENGVLTYRELNARANKLANFLRKRGAGPETIVGLCLERSLDVTVGMLAILKAGAACLPMDPTYPQERLDFMLKDAGVMLLVTQRRLAEQQFQGLPGVICVDADKSAISQEDPKGVVNLAAAENLAFVIYTSGSTGAPKGVLLTHRGLVNHHVAAARYYNLTPQDRVLQFASLSFDIALEEIFPTLISGARVVFRPDDLLIVGRHFVEWVEKRRITVLDLPTAFWHELVRELSSVCEQMPPALRLLIVGGDKALSSAFSQWRKMAGEGVRWINTYGPTETSVIVAAYEPSLVSDQVCSNIPIGKPIANTQIYILDAHLQPVPIGVAGELYLGGDGLARGYLNRPELTAQKFVPDPFAQHSGSRLYKTGDKARYLADGNIEFLGRMDEQVKIHGFRVEPEEIQTVLNSHPAVQEAFVMAREDHNRLKYLAAYVVANGQPPTAHELRSFLRRKLPEYMVPSVFAVLKTLPLTAHGKVDRVALPALETVGAEPQSFVPPQTPTESLIAEIWQQVLNIDRVGRFENFFDLGGYSLAAVQVVARLEERLGVRINPRQMMLQTLAQLASVYEDYEGVRQPPEEVSLTRRLLRGIRKAASA